LITEAPLRSVLISQGYSLSYIVAFLQASPELYENYRSLDQGCFNFEQNIFLGVEVLAIAHFHSKPSQKAPILRHFSIVFESQPPSLAEANSSEHPTPDVQFAARVDNDTIYIYIDR
jgi:hypothetical protein